MTSQKNEGLYVTGCHRRIVNIIGETKYLLIIVSSVVGLIVLIVVGMGNGLHSGALLCYRSSCPVWKIMSVSNCTWYLEYIYITHDRPRLISLTVTLQHSAIILSPQVCLVIFVDG